MVLDIKENASLNDASEIDEIVETIEKSMDELARVIKATIPDGIQTSWSLTLKDNWDKYYTSDVPEAMEDMKQSAKNLRTAVQNASAFSKEEQ